MPPCGKRETFLTLPFLSANQGISSFFCQNREEFTLEQGLDWGENRTNRLIETIKEWNIRPSFGKRIRRVCDKLRIPPPSERFLATRHRLLHLGDLVPTEGTMREYWTELEWLVLVMILRLLGYEGKMYHHKLGADAANLNDLLLPPRGNTESGPAHTAHEQEHT